MQSKNYSLDKLQKDCEEKFNYYYKLYLGE
jgi:hypothetical protein